MYEGGNLSLFLREGHAVAATDGAGYLDGQVHTYMVGANAGHALLDIVRASRQIPAAAWRPTGRSGSRATPRAAPRRCGARSSPRPTRRSWTSWGRRPAASRAT
ncbi:hypothetical protein [Actinomadura sp. WMMB 499]|uniref:hypothetical protein n=1 Tax=Actinomadura sp. WMMB 499 TaxID=1219491 RepID=UPI0020C7AB6D|nr:hypothetical protein [Actinomadura sp. WMMB 499]